MPYLLSCFLVFLFQESQAQTIAYLQDPDQLMQELPSYRAVEKALDAYKQELDHQGKQLETAYQELYQTIIQDFQRICATPKHELEVEDSLTRIQTRLGEALSYLDTLYQQKRTFLLCFVRDEWQCALAQLAEQEGYDFIIRATDLPYGGIDATPQLRLLLGLTSQKED